MCMLICLSGRILFCGVVFFDVFRVFDIILCVISLLVWSMLCVWTTNGLMRRYLWIRCLIYVLFSECCSRLLRRIVESSMISNIHVE